MLIIEHRLNSIESLLAVPIEHGCEIDVRNHGDKLIIEHDAFISHGVEFEKWLEFYRHRFLIINVKEEGLEEKILLALSRSGISDFFILDESFPFIRKWALNGVSQFALRVSEFENYQTPLDLCMSLKAQNKSVEWIWVDSFLGLPLPLFQANVLKEAGFKLCYVSPELHFLNEPDRWGVLLENFTKILESQSISPDAVCTKQPNAWAGFRAL